MSKSLPTVLVLGSRGKGGILTVIESIARSSLRRHWNLRHVPSHDSAGLLTRLALAARAGWTLLWLGATGRAQLLHLHSAMRGSFWRKAIYQRLGHWVGVPSVFHLHGSEMKVFYETQGPMGRRLIAAAFSEADRVVVLSESWRQFVSSVAPAARVSVVFNFVDMPPDVPSRRRAADEPLRLVFLGLIGERKGIFDLLQVVRLIDQHRPGALRLQVGGNGEVERLRSAVAEMGLGHCVDVLGWVDAPRRKELLSTCHALALPSYNEGLPMALLEAMSHGLPVLTTCVGGIPELVTDGEHGRLVQPGDARAMVAAIEEWLDDDASRTAMGSRARARVRSEFSAEVSVARLDEIYRAVMRGTPDAAA